MRSECLSAKAQEPGGPLLVAKRSGIVHVHGQPSVIVENVTELPAGHPVVKADPSAFKAK